MALPAEQELEEVIIPDGGIADFIISDEDFEELARQEARKTYGESGGIADFQEQAARMARHGRGGDQFVAHLAPGEIVVPAPLIENNPELRDSIFGHLRELGIENPEQYVVGSSANSINPETGLMEFGFLSDIWKGVKKVGKSVGKVLKKAAPIVLPIIGTAVLGPVWGAALGSGIATLINGGSLKQAAISAAISGGIGAFTAGIGGPGTFGQNLSQAMDAGSYLNTVGSRLGSTASTGEFFSEGSIFGRPGAATAGAPTTAAPTTGGPDTFSTSALPDVSPAASPTGYDVASYGDAAFAVAPEGTGTGVRQTASGDFLKDRFAASQTSVSPYETSVAVPKPKPPVPEFTQGPTFTSDLAAAAGPSPTVPTTVPGDVGPYNLDYSFMDAGYQDTVAPRGPIGRSLDAVQEYGRSLYEEPLTTLGDTFFPSRTTATDVLKANNINPLKANAAQLKAAEMMAADQSPGLLRTYGPLAAAGTAVAAGFGAFDTDDTEEKAAEERLAAMRAPILRGEQYLLPESAITPRTATGPTTVATDYGLPQGPQVTSLQEYLARQRQILERNPQMRAAEGGEVYPRRTGGIMPYEGTPNEDSVRALLMPGEFVMTQNAVKGAGNGDLNRGINNMYGIMRGLERRGRAMS